MRNNIISDNWSLQEVASLLTDGIDTDNVARLKLLDNEDGYAWEELPQYFIQIKLLIDLINDIVLRDQIIVDSEFAHAWNRGTLLSILFDKKIIKTESYPKRDADVLKLRESILDGICINDAMQKTQRENEEHWEKYRESKDNYFAQLVWGTAGILSCSAKMGSSYSPYPLRSDLLKQTFYNHGDETINIVEWMKQENATIYKVTTPSHSTIKASITLSPFAIQVINSTDSIDNIVKCALQYRESYSDIRSWIAEYQMAIESEDIRVIEKKKKVLGEVSEAMQSYNGNLTGGQTKMSLNFSLPSPSIGASFNLSRIKNLFGIRSSFCNLIVSSRSESGLKKLMSMLECDNRIAVNQLKNYLNGF